MYRANDTCLSRLENRIHIRMRLSVFWYSIPAQIKGVIDKLFSFYVAGKDIAGKECAMITCCEEESFNRKDVLAL